MMLYKQVEKRESEAGGGGYIRNWGMQVLQTDRNAENTRGMGTGKNRRIGNRNM